MNKHVNGFEHPDPTPLAMPIGMQREPTLQEQMQRFIRGEMQRQRMDLMPPDPFDDADEDEDGRYTQAELNALVEDFENDRKQSAVRGTDGERSERPDSGHRDRQGRADQGRRATDRQGPSGQPDPLQGGASERPGETDGDTPDGQRAGGGNTPAQRRA